MVAFVDPFPQNTLMRLDPHTLAGTPIVASRGPTLPLITSIAVEPTGTFVVVDSRLNAVARINERAESGPLSRMRPRAVDQCFSTSGTLRSRLRLS